MIRAAVAIAVSLAGLTALLWWNAMPPSSVLSRFTPGALAMGLLGGVGFILLKSFSLTKAASAAGVQLGPIGALRLFTQGVVIEVLTWPGKAWADAFRTMRLRKVAGISLGQAAAVTLTARAGAVAASAMLIGFAAASSLLDGHLADESRGWVSFAIAATVPVIP